MMGLRIGEVLALRWSDIDFDSRQLTVNHTLQRIKQKGESRSRLTLCETKTTASQATMTMPAPVVEALRQHRARQIDEGIARTGYVFTTGIGTPLQDGKIRQRFYALLKAAGLPRIKFHGLRHSCASFLIAKGVPARMVMEWMRHRQIATTMNIYGHIIPTLRQQAVDAMDAMFSRKTS